MSAKKVWFVTGASKGLGLTLVKRSLSKGYLVAATSRDKSIFENEVSASNDSFLGLNMDVTSNQDVKRAVDTAVSHFGRIDVVVNNAGFAQIGTVEELSDAEVKNSFDVNVFGSLNVIRHAVPHLRKQRYGHIFNISSIGGYSGGFAGFGIYCSTKFAVAGFTESLAEEMKAFDVNVTLVYPGYFRTHFLSKGSVKTAAHPIADYSSARALEQIHLNEINGNQPNDPEKAAGIFIAVSELQNPPVHLFLGSDAYDIAEQKIGMIQQTMAEYKTLATSTEIVHT